MNIGTIIEGAYYKSLLGEKLIGPMIKHIIDGKTYWKHITETTFNKEHYNLYTNKGTNFNRIPQATLLVDMPLDNFGNPFNKPLEQSPVFKSFMEAMFLVDDLNKLKNENKDLKDKLFDLEYRQTIFKTYIQNIYDDLMESNRKNGYNYQETISINIYRHILELINGKS